jgi:hypothetical protein
VPGTQQLENVPVAGGVQDSLQYDVIAVVEGEPDGLLDQCGCGPSGLVAFPQTDYHQDGIQRSGRRDVGH